MPGFSVPPPTANPGPSQMAADNAFPLPPVAPQLRPGVPQLPPGVPQPPPGRALGEPINEAMIQHIVDQRLKRLTSRRSRRKRNGKRRPTRGYEVGSDASITASFNGRAFLFADAQQGLHHAPGRMVPMGQRLVELVRRPGGGEQRPHLPNAAATSFIRLGRHWPAAGRRLLPPDPPHR